MEKIYKLNYDLKRTTNHFGVHLENTTTTPSLSFTLVDSRSAGAPKPNWKALIAAHSDATTSLSGSRQLFQKEGSDDATVYYHTTSGADQYPAEEKFTGVLPFNSLLPATVGDNDTAAYQVVLGKIYKLLADRQAAFQSGVFLGELRETLKMLRHPARGLLNYIKGETYRKYRRGDRILRRIPNAGKRKAAARKMSADLWLETAFGWKPFISDIESAKEAYDRLTSDLQFEEFNVFGKSERVTSPTRTTMNISRLRWTEERYVKTMTSYRLYGETYFAFNGPKAQLGITWNQFVPTVWELIPYSFLVDYFTNIGDLLTAYSVDLSIVKRISRVRFRETSVHISRYGLRKGSFGDEDSVSGHLPPIVLRNQNFNRSIGATLYPPMFRLEVPGTNSTKWINILALANGRLKGGTRNFRL